MNYSAHSSFVKKRILRTRFCDRAVIDDLLRIEQHALGKVTGIALGYSRAYLRSKYTTEWLEIHRELNPDAYKREKEHLHKEKLQHEKLKQEQVYDERRDYESWLKAGGLA